MTDESGNNIFEVDYHVKYVPSSVQKDHATALQFSKDGLRLLILKADGAMYLYDVLRMSLIRCFKEKLPNLPDGWYPPPDPDITNRFYGAVTQSPNHRLVACAGTEFTPYRCQSRIDVYEVVTGKCITEHIKHRLCNSKIRHLSFVCNSNKLLVITDTGSLYIYVLYTRRGVSPYIKFTHRFSGAPVSCASMCPKNRRFGIVGTTEGCLIPFTIDWPKHFSQDNKDNKERIPIDIKRRLHIYDGNVQDIQYSNEKVFAGIHKFGGYHNCMTLAICTIDEHGLTPKGIFQIGSVSTTMRVCAIADDSLTTAYVVESNTLVRYDTEYGISCDTYSRRLAKILLARRSFPTELIRHVLNFI